MRTFSVIFEYRDGSGEDYSMPTASGRITVEAEDADSARIAAISAAYADNANISHVRPLMVREIGGDDDAR